MKTKEMLEYEIFNLRKELAATNKNNSILKKMLWHSIQINSSFLDGISKEIIDRLK